MSGGKLDCLYSGQQQRSVALSRRSEAAVYVCVCVRLLCLKARLQGSRASIKWCGWRLRMFSYRWISACTPCSHVCACLHREGRAVPASTRSLTDKRNSVLSDPRAAAALRGGQASPRPGQRGSPGRRSKFRRHKLVYKTQVGGNTVIIKIHVP